MVSLPPRTIPLEGSACRSANETGIPPPHKRSEEIIPPTQKATLAIILVLNVRGGCIVVWLHVLYVLYVLYVFICVLLIYERLL